MANPEAPATALVQAELDEFCASNADFAFEMQVLSSLDDGNVRLAHGGAYDDPKTGLTRQFDIRAEITDDQTIGRFAIECKNISVESALIGHLVPRRSEESGLWILDHSLPGYSAHSKFLHNRDVYRERAPVC